MRYVRDATGRFRERPYYELRELDAECETLVGDFLRKRYGRVDYPLSTDDLTVLLESMVLDLDLFADLSKEGENVEGVTYFRATGKPKVAIAAVLSEEQWRENRLRTTLSHELSHVKFHGFVWALEIEEAAQAESVGRRRSGWYNRDDMVRPPASAGVDVRGAAKCKRENILGPTNQIDWMEWQAGYGCGAILIPRTELEYVLRRVKADPSPPPNSPEGVQRIAAVQGVFAVSADAARVRLLQTGYLSQPGAVPSGI